MKTFASTAFCTFLVAAITTSSTPAHAEDADLTAACRETGDDVACTAAGLPMETSSIEFAVELYTLACAKRPDKCGALVAFAQRRLRAREGARAMQALEKGCEVRSARACSTLAAELEEGERSIPHDFAKAARFHDKACELGLARDCLLLAVMVDDGRGARREPARAQRLRARSETLEKAAIAAAAATPVALVPGDDAICRKTRDASRCLAAGTALQATDAVKAEELYRIGCASDKSRCGLWGFALERLRRDDPSRGMRVLEEGCVQGASLACVVLADLHHTGYRALARDEARAAELYDRACTLGEPAGCRVTASRFRGVRDAARADELQSRAATLEAEADKPLLQLQEAWVKDAGQRSAREAYLRELERRTAEWHLLARRSQARWEVRMQRLAQVDNGVEPQPLAPVTDSEGSAARLAAIRRMAKTLFP